MSLGLQYDGAVERYDYQGVWTLSGTQKSVVRDWRHLRVATSYPEYVMTPHYDLT